MEYAGHVDDLEEGRPRTVTFDGREVALVRWRATVYAFRNYCPHQGAPMGVGRVMPRIDSAGGPGTIVVDESAPVVSCPWHSWEFSLDSGKGVCEGAGQLRTYPAQVDDSGDIWVQLRRTEAPQGVPVEAP